MGYGVYWSNGRWQGYQIPAYCDYKDCKEEIDRGMAYQHEEEKEFSDPNTFVCNKHQEIPLEEIEIDCKKEHPEWLEWILTHESWDKWRKENPDIVSEYKKILEDS